MGIIRFIKSLFNNTESKFEKLYTQYPIEIRAYVAKGGLHSGTRSLSQLTKKDKSEIIYYLPKIRNEYHSHKQELERQRKQHIEEQRQLYQLQQAINKHIKAYPRALTQIVYEETNKFLLTEQMPKSAFSHYSIANEYNENLECRDSTKILADITFLTKSQLLRITNRSSEFSNLNIVLNHAYKEELVEKENLEARISEIIQQYNKGFPIVCYNRIGVLYPTVALPNWAFNNLETLVKYEYLLKSITNTPIVNYPAINSVLTNTPFVLEVKDFLITHKRKLVANESEYKKVENRIKRKLKAEQQKKLEEERQRKLEAERQKKLEEERQRKLEAERQKKLEEERQRKLEAEQQKKLEEERQRKLEAERQKKLEEERQRKLEAERQKKLEEERQRKLEAEQQKKLEEERSNLKTKISDWESIYNIPYFYFYHYYPLTCDFEADHVIWKIRKLIWNFKNDPAKTSIRNHEMSSGILMSFLSEFLINTFEENTSKLTLTCIPASSQKQTELRFKSFLKQTCFQSGAQNGYDYIKVVKDRVPKHLSGIREEAVLSFDTDQLKNKNIIIIDDIITSGKSLLKMKEELESRGAYVLGAIFMGKTTHTRAQSEPIEVFRGYKLYS